MFDATAQVDTGEVFGCLVFWHVCVRMQSGLLQYMSFFLRLYRDFRRMTFTAQQIGYKKCSLVPCAKMANYYFSLKASLTVVRLLLIELLVASSTAQETLHPI